MPGSPEPSLIDLQNQLRILKQQVERNSTPDSVHRTLAEADRNVATAERRAASFERRLASKNRWIARLREEVEEVTEQNNQLALDVAWLEQRLAFVLEYLPEGFDIFQMQLPIVDIKTMARFIVNEVCQLYGVTVDDLTDSSRQPNIVRGRHLAFYLFRALTDFTFAQIGQMFGGRNHTSVMHGVRRIREQMAVELELFENIERICSLAGQPIKESVRSKSFSVVRRLAADLARAQAVLDEFETRPDIDPSNRSHQQTRERLTAAVQDLEQRLRQYSVTVND
jgi:hypothetical protein